MARQQESCWKCGVAWLVHCQSSTPGQPVTADGPVTTTHFGLERWFDEGGSVDTEPANEPAVAAAEREAVTA
jgi:hypothetical protein